MILRKRKFKALETALGYKFKSEAMLEQALTHSSVRGADAKRQDNERLEFVGDRVLGLAIVEMLHENHPKAKEGEIARHYNALVRAEACAHVARTIDLGASMKLSTSEAESGGRDKDGILADAMEAVLGAVFLDGGYLKARDVVRRIWIVDGRSRSAAPNGGVGDVAAHIDPKSALQEWAQGRGLPLPRYSSPERTGPDHAPVFTAEVALPGWQAARGTGLSKRTAEQAAARELLTAVLADPDGGGRSASVSGARSAKKKPTKTDGKQPHE
jgi:ribonuclease-3